MGFMLKANPILNLFKYTWRYSAGNRRKVVLFVLMSLLANGIQLFEPVILSRAFNQVQLAPNDPGLLKYVISNVSLLLLITLTFWMLHGTSRVIERGNAFLVRKNYKLDMFNKVLTLPVAWHKDHHSGDTIDKINKASEGLYEFSSLIFVITTNGVRLFGGVIALWFFDRLASFLALGIAVLALFMVAKFDSIIRKRLYEVFKAENSLASAIYDYISNIITIITLRLKSRVSNEIEARSMVAFRPFSRINVLGETKWFFASFSLSVMIVSVLILNAYRSYAETGVIMVGTLFALYLYLRRIGDTFFDFALRYGEMVKQDASVRAADVVVADYDKIESKTPQFLPMLWREIEIKNLSFQYPNEDNPEHKRVHLENINFAVKRNQRIALIGESGSGKSTLLALLRGLYPPNHAEVYADGRKLEHGLSHLYEHVTLIPQDPEIFNSSIEDNITMETHVEQKDLLEAIELAQFKSTVGRLPKGLQTNVLEKGVSLSGGEKQRLALARGILAGRNSEFLFMDEPTSSIDTDNELKIYNNIFERFPDKTIISSIHRLHLLRLFDMIYYFKEGRIAASGSLDELLEHPEVNHLWEKYKITAKQ